MNDINEALEELGYEDEISLEISNERKKIIRLDSGFRWNCFRF